MPVPPGLLQIYRKLTETPSAEVEQRTAWNVRDANATLLIMKGSSIADSPGSVFTKICAELIFLRPLHLADLREMRAAEDAFKWLVEVHSRLPTAEFSVNVAGPRESESPGIYD